MSFITLEMTQMEKSEKMSLKIWPRTEKKCRLPKYRLGKKFFDFDPSHLIPFHNLRKYRSPDSVAQFWMSVLLGRVLLISFDKNTFGCSGLSSGVNRDRKV